MIHIYISLIFDFTFYQKNFTIYKINKNQMEQNDK